MTFLHEAIRITQLYERVWVNENGMDLNFKNNRWEVSGKK